jgi:hypothetical protein
VPPPHASLPPALWFRCGCCHALWRAIVRVLPRPPSTHAHPLGGACVCANETSCMGPQFGGTCVCANETSCVAPPPRLVARVCVRMRRRVFGPRAVFVQATVDEYEHCLAAMVAAQEQWQLVCDSMPGCACTHAHPRLCAHPQSHTLLPPAHAHTLAREHSRALAFPRPNANTHVHSLARERTIARFYARTRTPLRAPALPHALAARARAHPCTRTHTRLSAPERPNANTHVHSHARDRTCARLYARTRRRASLLAHAHTRWPSHAHTRARTHSRSPCRVHPHALALPRPPTRSPSRARTRVCGVAFVHVCVFV